MGEIWEDCIRSPQFQPMLSLSSTFSKTGVGGSVAMAKDI